MGKSARFGPGEVFGNLRVEDQIGAGAFGVVYRAHDTVLDRAVALKVCSMHGRNAADPGLDRALIEARFTAKFHHPNIVTLYRVHPLSDDTVAYEMEFVGGGTLASLADASRPIDVHMAMLIARGVTSAVHAAHEAGVIHGDIKPSNILLAEDGTPKLADFGLASLQRARTDESQDFAPGTPLYMAPEVLMGAPPTPASDIWSLGLTLYELFAGRYPFRAQGFQQLFWAIQNATPKLESDRFPPVFESCISKCLAKSPADRPTSAEMDDLLRGSSRPRDARAIPDAGAPSVIGRGEELDRIVTRVESTADGSPATLLIEGEPGMGKTTVVLDMARRLAGHGMHTMIVRDWTRDGVASALLRAVRRELHESDGWSGSPTSGRVLDELFDEGPDRVESRGQLVEAAHSALGCLASPGGVCVVVEDVHEGSDDDIRFLSALLRRRRDLGIPFVFTTRVSGRSALLGHSDGPTQAELLQREVDFEVLRLGPLPDEAIARIVAAERYHVNPHVTRRIVETAEGNPLLALEVFRFLLATGGVELEGDSVDPGRSWSRKELPGRLRNVVLARIDQLSSDEQALLEVAAVAGRRFDPTLVAGTLDRNLLDVLRVMQNLYRRTSLIVPEDHRFAFSHSLIHEAVVGTIAPALHKELSRLMAEQLESEDPRDDELLGRHWSRAGQPEKARPYLVAAANRAERRQQNQRAIELFEMAGFLPGATTDALLTEYAESLLAQAACYSDLGAKDSADRIYRDLREVARGEPNQELYRRVVARSAKFRFFFAGPSAVDTEELRSAVDSLPPGKSRAAGLYVLGLLSRSAGSYDDAALRFREAYRDFRLAGRMSGCSDAVDQLGTIAKRRGRFRRAARLYRLAARMSEQVGRRMNACVSRFNEAVTRFEAGGASESVEALLRQCVTVLEFEGSPQLAAHAYTILAQVDWAAGRASEAFASLDAAESLLRNRSFIRAERALHMLRAQYLAVRGEAAESRHHVKAARRRAKDSDDGDYQLDLDLIEVLAAAVDGQAERANELVREAWDRAVSPRAPSHAIFLTALIELAGVDLRRNRALRGARQAADDVWRATLIAARLLKRDGRSARSVETARQRLLDPSSVYERRFLDALASALAPNSSERERARSAAAELGTPLLDRWLEARTTDVQP